MTPSLRTILLALSPRYPVAAVKNFLLWRRLTKDESALKLWNRYFNALEYLSQYPDIAGAQVSPLVHFLLRGNVELRSPSALFDIHYYLERYPDVAASGVNALLHFALFGRRQGRTIPLLQPELERAQLIDPSTSTSAIFINNDWEPECPLVSVVIPCFNYGALVEQAIRSALNQTFSDLEIIVVEGGSTEPSSIEDVRRIEAVSLPKTRFYYRAERHLAGDNRNFGISQARGRYICCLDADDLLRPVYLEVAVFLAEYFGYDIVSPSVQTFGESNDQCLMSAPRFSAIFTENGIASAAVFRRNAWSDVGGYRDWGLGREYVYEDWDFWIRLLGHGFLATSIGEPLFLYRTHEGSLTNGSRLDLDVQRKRLQEANSGLRTNFKEAETHSRWVMNPWENLIPQSNEPPALLLALPFITIGGGEKLFRTLAEHIVARGQRLVVITSTTLPKSVPDDAASFERITPHVYHLSRLFSTDQARQAFLRYLIRRYSVTSLMLAGCELVYHLLPTLKSEFPDMVVLDQLFNDSVHIPNNRRYAGAIDATVVPSKQLFDSLVTKHHASLSSIRIIPHRVRVERVRDDVDTNPICAEAKGKVIVSFFGRHSSEKAPDLFVDIAAALRSHDKLFFVMTGEGPERQNVLARIRKRQLEERFYTPGFVDNVVALMQASDIVVLPSRIDGMPLAVLEAQALGKPVVASRVGSLPEMIEDKISGFLCDIADVSGFCQRIVQLADDPELRERMGIAAQRISAERYSVQGMLDAYESLFHSARENIQSVATASSPR
jgi:glycosyltransferase involved in cell wall biosynthesis